MVGWPAREIVQMPSEAKSAHTWAFWNDLAPKEGVSCPGERRELCERFRIAEVQAEKEPNRKGAADGYTERNPLGCLIWTQCEAKG